MKKKLVFLVIIIVLCAIGVYFVINQNNSNSHLKKLMEDASKDYFKNYISTNDSASTYEITLDMLNEVNKDGKTYNLKGLENCNKKKTVTRITINYNTGNPKKVETELSC